ncbi:hypothetical protein MTO96_042693, partial [Rhipicephalus appendiculatus]
ELRNDKGLLLVQSRKPATLFQETSPSTGQRVHSGTQHI